MQFMTHYNSLQIDFGASQEEIKQAYLQECLKEKKDPALFQIISKAFEVLSDPEKRKTYDLQIQRRLKIQLESDAPKKSLSKIANQFYQAFRERRFEKAMALIQMHQISPLLIVKDPLEFKGPLFLAAVQSGNVELLRAFCKEELPDFTAKGRVYSEGACKEEKSALFFAVQSGNVDMVRYLCEQGLHIANEPTLLEIAIAQQSVEMVQFLVAAKLPVTHTHLQQACQLGNEAMVKTLINILPQKIDVKTAIHSIQGGNVAIARLLLTLLSPGQLDEPALQALFKALGEARSIEMAELVLKEWQLLEAIPNCLKEWTWIKPLLSYTVLYNKSKTPSLNWLRYLFTELKITPTPQDLEGLLKEKLAVRAVEDEAYLQRLLTKGEVKAIYETVLQKGLEGLSFDESLRFYILNLQLRQFSSYYSHLNAALTIHIRTLFKKKHFTNDLLKQKAQIDGRFRQEALLFFCYEYVKDEASKIQILIETGANVNDTETVPGYTPLFCAALSCDRSKCKQLIEAGADANFMDPRGRPISSFITPENKQLAALFSSVKSGNIDKVRTLSPIELDEASLYALFKALGDTRSIEMAKLVLIEWQLLERIPNCLNEWKWIEALLSPTVLRQNQNPGKPYTTVLSYIRESDSSTMNWLRYLFEDLKMVPPKEELQKLLNIKWNVRTVKVEAYLQTYATEGELKTLYENLLEKDIEGLSYHESIWLYVLNLQQIRGSYMHGLLNSELIPSIQQKETNEMLELKAKEDARFRQHALIFYCNENTFNDPASKVKILIDAGADVNDTETIPNRSPLSFAIDACDPSVIHLLVKAGADVDFADSEGNPIRDRLPDS